MNRFVFGIVILLLNAYSAVGQVFDVVVDASGDGDYTTVQSAIDAVTDYSATRTLIFVKSGTYTEKVWVGDTKWNVSLIGEDVNTVSIEWDDYQGKDGMSGADSYTFLAEGDGLYLENITIKNTAGPVGQAVAIRTIGDKSAFKNCIFLGNQDTYYAHKDRQYNYKCTVEGNVDFIYGDATCVFEDCTIRSNAAGYVTAPADAKIITNFGGGVYFYHGLQFRSCDVVAGSGVSDESVYLGRPWQDYSSSVFIQCTLGSHINAKGWTTMGDNTELTAVFAEYQNVDTEGNLVDVTNRVDWSSQLTSTDLNKYALSFFFRKDGVTWDPIPVLTPLYDPQNVAISSNTLSWDEVTGTEGYVIYENDIVIGFSATNTFTDDTPSSIDAYKVVSVSTSGALSDGTVDPTSGIVGYTKDNIKVEYDNRTILLSEESDIDVYNISGNIVASASNSNILSVEHLTAGIYIVKISTDKGFVITKKILVN